MKSNYKLPVILLITTAVSLSSCYKDKGNYDYKDINQLSISDAAAGGMISVNQGDTLRLQPVINQTTGTNEADLEYEWKVYDNSASSEYTLPVTVISTDRNLNNVITDPPFTLGQNYRLTFKATDKRTGVSAFMQYNLIIANKFAQGWMLLEDKPTGGDLAMILPNGMVEYNVYSERNSTAPLGKPVKLDITPFMITDAVSADSKKIYILSDNAGQELNYLTLQKKFDYGYLFYSAPAQTKPQRMTWASTTTGDPILRGSLGIVINDGKVHANLVGGFPGSKKWGEALLAPTVGANYNAAPFVAGGTTYTAVVYDNIGKHFYSVGQTILSTFPAVASTVFDMNNVGMDLLYMDSANVIREYNAIMKDAGTSYLLRFKLVTTAADPAVTLAKTQMNAPEILQMTAAAGSTATPHIYYAAANKIYRYETTSNTTVLQYSLPAGETVTSMKFYRAMAAPDKSKLVVATWNGTAGKVYYFPVSAVGDFNNYSDVFEGFARIIDMGYKYP